MFLKCPIAADADEDLNDEVCLNTDTFEENEVDNDNEKGDKKIEKILDNAMVENYMYDKKHHLWAKLTFNVSFIFFFLICQIGHCIFVYLLCNWI